MNEQTIAVITALKDAFQSIWENIDNRSVAFRLQENLTGRLDVKYQVCFTAANAHEFSGDLEYAKAQFNKQVGDRFSQIEMRAFRFEDLEGLKKSFDELSRHYRFQYENDVFRNIKDEDPVYIVAFLIPQILIRQN